MDRASDQGRRLYKARRPDGELAWVDHDELWRLQQGQAEALRRAQRRRRRRVMVAVAGLVAVALALLLWRLGSEVGPAPPPAAEAAGADPLPAATTAEEPPAPAAAVPPPPEARVEAAVERWAEAWARRDVAAYLASYAADFQPAEGLSRPGWERWRRERLLAPASIRLEIEELEVAVGERGRAEARFLQTYVSPDYSDVVRKTLRLVEEEGEWRIAGERAEAP